MEFHIVTLFPEMFETVFDASLLGKARKKEIISISVHDLREWGTSKHDNVDDRPYGGGPGMVIKPEPVFEAVEDLRETYGEKLQPVLLSPRGNRLDQSRVEEFVEDQSPLLLICGHYEGFDERIRKGLDLIELSIGDYVLSGGEFAAMVLVDAVSRLIPGVVGEPESLEEESFTTGKLDFPQYTRPRAYRGMEVPEILLSGDHEAIREWRQNQRNHITQKHRPDLIDTPDESEDEA